MDRANITTGEVQPVNAPFVSKTDKILDDTDVTELYKNASEKIMESIAAFQMTGSNWQFRRVIKLDINMMIFILMYLVMKMAKFTHYTTRKMKIP